MNLLKRFCAGQLFYFAPDGDGGGGVAGASADTPATGQEPGVTPRSYDETYVSKLRGEAADHRTKKNEALEDARTQRERADAAERERDQLKGERTQAAVETAYKDAAAEAGAKSPATIAKLLKLETIKGADTGTPDAAEVKAKLAALKTSDPDLFKTVGPTGRDASAGSGAGSGKTDINQYFRDKLRR